MFQEYKTAWMTCEIFQEFLVALDRRMVSKSGKILLFVDHCHAHRKDVRNFKKCASGVLSYKHISVATYGPGYHQGPKTEVL
jgi:hypothetical protein